MLSNRQRKNKANRTGVEFSERTIPNERARVPCVGMGERGNYHRAVVLGGYSV